MAAKKVTAATKVAKEVKTQYMTSVDDAIDSSYYVANSQDETLRMAYDDMGDGKQTYYVYKIQLVGKFVSKQIFEEVK